MDKGFPQAIVLQTVACVFLVLCWLRRGSAYTLCSVWRKNASRNGEKSENSSLFQIVKQIDDIGIRLL